MKWNDLVGKDIVINEWTNRQKIKDVVEIDHQDFLLTTDGIYYNTERIEWWAHKKKIW